MSDAGIEGARERALRERAARTIQQLRFYLLAELLAAFGLLLFVAQDVIGDRLWENVLRDHALLPWVRQVSLFVSGMLSLIGLAGAAQAFLRFGVMTPFGLIRLERQHAFELENTSIIDGYTEEIEEDGNTREDMEISNEDAPSFIDEYRVTSFVGRIEREIEEQGNRANLNLILGGLTALLALGVLVWLTVDSANALSEAISRSQKVQNIGSSLEAYMYWGPFVSKIFMSSTAAFFAFFFLSTYRRNLAEIRYFHNELTNIESRIVAIEYCSNTLDGDDAKLDILKSMGATERNFILRRGESTTDLAQKEMDRREMAAWAEAIATAMQRVAAQKPPH